MAALIPLCIVKVEDITVKSDIIFILVSPSADRPSIRSNGEYSILDVP